MRLGAWLQLLLLAGAGCPRPEEDSPPKETGAPTDDTDPTTIPTQETGEPADPISIDCVEQQPPAALTLAGPLPEGNTLRFDCSVHVDPPQPVEVTFQKVNGQGPLRVHASDVAQADHEVTLYLMAPETGYTITATATNNREITEEIKVTTGDLPPGAQAVISTVGESTSPLLGMASPCADAAYVIILDPSTREVLWYQNFALTVFGFIDAVSFTEDQTVLVIADGSLVEVDLAGNELNRVFSGVDVPGRFHHDAFRKDGLTYVLFSEEVTVGEQLYSLDGFYIFDPSYQLIGEWHLKDHITPIPSETSLFIIDYSHANSIWVDDNDNVIVSFRHLSAVAQIDGDTSSERFGTIEWAAAPAVSPLSSDFVVYDGSTPSNFQQQHNVHFLPDGRLTMLDNRIAWEENSRVLELSLDFAGGVMKIEAEYELPQHCDFQGGAWQTPAGHPLATCAPMRYGYEFDPSTGQILWQGNVSCLDEFGSYIPRFVPLDW